MQNNSYNEIPYPNYVFSETHPGRIAGNARIFGLNCAMPEKSRILDIGCAGGLNLLSHATSLPDAQFVGIDLDKNQIAQANELKDLTGIRNIEFLCAGVETLDENIGRFDYIICHGLFSWVESEVRDRILKACSALLSENGVAYISYNCLPGWHIQNIFRESMLYATKDIVNPEEKITKAKEFLKFAKDLYPEDIQAHFYPIIDHLLETPEHYLFHDHLGKINNPLYFYQFIEQCDKHNLMFLAESDLSTMLAHEFPSVIKQEIISMAKGSLSQTEQYYDLLRLRSFRKSLICRNTATIERALHPAVLKNLSVGVRKSAENNIFQSKKIISDSDFSILENTFPCWQSVSRLIKDKSDEETDIYLSDLLQLVLLDVVEVRGDECSISRETNDLKKLSPLAQVLMNYGNVVPNLRSEAVVLKQELVDKILKREKLGNEDYLVLQRLGLFNV